MKERPILFSGSMVRALLDGSKTQTRRIVKPQPAIKQGMVNAAYCGDRNLWLRDGPCDSSDPAKEWRCPYGQPGDRLWVRESWIPDPPDEGDWGYTAWAGCSIGQIAGVPKQYRSPTHCLYAATQEARSNLRWTPSIHMPRWASRITLEVASVRVERLQAISEADARAEGITDGGCLNCGNPEPCGCAAPEPDARESYCHLWGQINGPDSWAANPWVWVVEFRPCPHP